MDKRDRQPASTDVLFLTRRFWPHTDDSVGRLNSLAVGLRRKGINPTILSPRYAASWPQELTYYENEVLRPVVAPRSDWSMPLYQRALSKWLQENLRRFRLAYVDSMREEAAILSEIAPKAGIPWVCRCAGVGSVGDLHWACRSRAARKTFTSATKSQAIVVNSPEKARELVSFGVTQEKLMRCDDGVLPPLRRDPVLAQKARACLYEINPDLGVARDEQVLVVCAELSTHSNLLSIIKSIGGYLRSKSSLKVWIVGDGPLRHEIHAWLCDQGLRDDIAMPGCFGHDEELYQAADLFLVTELGDNIEHRLPMAISAGLPVIILDCPLTRYFFSGASVEPYYFSEKDPASLIAQITHILRDREETAKAAAQLRQSMLAAKPRQVYIEAHWKLFQSLIHQHGGFQDS